MAVLMSSDVAKLVLDYLAEEDLPEVYELFCEKSLHLKEEYRVLKGGFSICRMHDLSLLDIIREFVEIKQIICQYIKSLPENEAILQEKDLVKKIRLLLYGQMESVSNCQQMPASSAKRKRSDTAEASTSATKISEVSGYVPPAKRLRPSSHIIPEQSPKMCFSKDICDLSAENIKYPINSESGVDEMDKLNVFSETMLQNRDFQNVLVDNINRILEARLDQSTVEANSVNYSRNVDNRSYQNEINNVIENIIQSTEENPIFEQVLNDCVQNTADNPNWGFDKSTVPFVIPKTDDNVDSTEDIPLKQRLRKRENLPKKRGPKVKPFKRPIKVHSCEPYTGNISDVIGCIPNNTENQQLQQQQQPSTTQGTQYYILNSNTNSLANIPSEAIVINIPSIMMSSDGVQIPFILDGDHQGISVESGMILDTDIIRNQTVSEEVFQDITKENDQSAVGLKSQKSIETSGVETMTEKTPLATSSQLNQVKAKSLSTPRRKSSHVRVLNFNTPAIVESAENFDLSAQPSNASPKTVSKSVTIPNSVPAKVPSKPDIDEEFKNKAIELIDKIRSSQESTGDIGDRNLLSDNGGLIISVPVKDKKESCSRASLSQKKILKNINKTGESTDLNEVKSLENNQKKINSIEEWKEYRSINKNEWDQHIRANAIVNNRKITRKRRKRRGVKLNSPNEQPNKSNSDSKKEIKKKDDANTSDKSISIKLTPKKLKRSQRIKKQVKSAKALEKSNKSAKSSADEISKVQKQGESDNDSKGQSPGESVVYPMQSTSMQNNQKMTESLETPFKNDNTIPPTPRLALPSLQATPMIKPPRLNLIRNSQVKCSEFPTPIFPITPGIVLTPTLGSPKSGTYSNRPTDYSSGSSYYKPDESDDIDKNFDLLLRKTPDHIEPTVIVDEDENIGMNPKTTIQEIDEKLNEALQPTSKLPAKNIVQQKEEQRKLNNSRLLSKLETARMRTIQKLQKRGPEIIKPKPMSFSERRSKLQTARKQLTNTTHQTSQLSSSSSSKRKMSSPIKRVTTNCQSDTKELPTLFPTVSRSLDPETELKLAISNIMPPGESQTKLNIENELSMDMVPQISFDSVDTLPIDLNSSTDKDKFTKNISTRRNIDALRSNDTDGNTPKDNTNKLTSKPILESKDRRSTRREQEKELFGETTISDSDYLDTPVKISNKSDYSGKGRISPIQSDKKPSSSHSTSDSESESEFEDDPYDQCTLSCNNSNISNELIEHCFSVNTQQTKSSPKNEKKFVSTIICIDNEKIRLDVTEEITLFSSQPNSGNLDILRNEINSNNESVHRYVEKKENNEKVRTKNDDRKQMSLAEGNDLTENEDGDFKFSDISNSTNNQGNTISHQQKKSLQQTDTKVFDIESVLLKVHPSN